MIPELVKSLWAHEQAVLTAAIAVCSFVLAVAWRWRSASAEVEPASLSEPAEAPPAESPSTQRCRGGWVAGFVLVVVVAAVGAFLVYRGDNPLGVRLDTWSDANVIVSGRNYAYQGFRTHFGAAQHQVVTDANPPDPFFIYTQYPVASNVINGLWQSAGVTSMRLFRLVPALCSLLAVVVWFGLFRRFAGPAVAMVAAAAMATCHAFLAYADNLHFHGYALLLCSLAVWAYVRAMAPTTRRRRWWFGLTAVCLSAMACFTWEYHLWMVLFIAVYSFLFACPVRRRWLAMLGLPLIVVLVCQTVQRRVALAEAGVATSVTREGRLGFLDDLHRRTIGFESATDTPDGLTLRGYPAHLLRRLQQGYGLSVFAVVAMMVPLALGQRPPPWRAEAWTPALRLLVVLLVASVGWWFVMVQHTAVHPHTMRHALPAYALLMGLMWVLCWRTLRSPRFGPVVQTTAIGFAALLLYPHAEGLVANVWLHVGGGDLRTKERGDLGWTVAEQYRPLEEAVPPGGVILTDCAPIAPMRVWSRRPVYCASFFSIPKDDPERARPMIDLRLYHLRGLYGEKRPPLYYVYATGRADVRALASANTALFLKLLLHGPRFKDRSLAETVRMLEAARAAGRHDESYCPIVAMNDDWICFQMDRIADFTMERVMPVVRGRLAETGPPTMRQFGPPF